MASDTSDESSNEVSEELPPRLQRIPNNNLQKVQQHSARERQRTKHKHQGDYNTFVVPEILCQCQQRCTERVAPALIQKICMYFFGMKGNKERQKSYLASLILAKEKQLDLNALKGKRIRKMSYRYFVPILTDKDLKDQSEENIILQNLGYMDLKNNKSKKYLVQTSQNCKAIPLFQEKNWDHVEVCLKAFTTVHVISEKKVIVTRSVCQLKSTMKCSKPFNKDNQNTIHTTLPQKSFISSAIGVSRPENMDVASTNDAYDVSAATAAWLTEYCRKNTPFPVNPKTFLPEGLILPDSMICLPIFKDGDYIPSNPDRDIDIVDNFFFNQLWKPEYISNSGTIRKHKKNA